MDFEDGYAPKAPLYAPFSCWGAAMHNLLSAAISEGKTPVRFILDPRIISDFMDERVRARDVNLVFGEPGSVFYYRVPVFASNEGINAIMLDAV